MKYVPRTALEPDKHNALEETLKAIRRFMAMELQKVHASTKFY